ncbi:MAG: hypothetical protein C5B50_13860 [Verrucomicrobia bacterium]|nr:MAG: hypothetical protein C5B50_13860 [Verrucomicrobiota bacterium]
MQQQHNARDTRQVSSATNELTRNHKTLAPLMKSNHPEKEITSARFLPVWKHVRPLAAIALSSSFLLLAAQAGTFFSDFNSGTLPAGATVFGSASVTNTTGGYTNSGYLQLTPLALSQQGAFVITNDLDAGAPVVSFVARFKAFDFSSGQGADGWSFNFATDVPFANTISEEGAGTGLTVEYDTYQNNGGDLEGIDLKAFGFENWTQPLGDSILRPNAWVDVVLMLHPDQTVGVAFDGTWVYTNAASGFGGVNSPIVGGFFGIGGRTGGVDDPHWLDNLSINTKTNGAPFIMSFNPIGRQVRADAPINITLEDNTTAVDTNRLTLTIDGSPVAAAIIQFPDPNNSVTMTSVGILPASVFASGSSHTVSLTYADNSVPPVTNSWDWSFTVAPYSALPATLAADPSFVNLNSQGFFTRYSQIADSGSRDVSRAELQLANALIDGSTGQPYPNLAAPNPADGTFTYFETNVINYGFPAGTTGNFPNDTTVPGMPGPTTGTGSSFAMDAVTYLHLSPGLYNLGVNSSDGFKFTVADGADIFALQEAIFSSVRAAADSTVSLSVSQDGYYPFRIVYFTGDPSFGPAPGTTTPSLEFFNIDRFSNKILINDTNTMGYVPAFNAAKTKPYIRSVSPNIGDTGVPGNAGIRATLVDQSLAVRDSTIVLRVNGATVSPTISSNSGIHTVNYQPALAFAPNSSNFVSIAFTDTGANVRSNAWSFTVANIMTAIWTIPAVNNTWVTAGSTERGLAYNPKTGHLLLVSRAASPAPANGLGVAIMDSGNGNVLGTLNLGTIGSSGVGTFKLNMVDVADDGVIYICNLTTSATVAFQIYRWSDESSAPQLVYSANPIGGASRCGDDFRVRGSGSGTQIIASGNSAVTTIPVFTTLDGTNFTGTALNISGILANSLRLGLAWGCGKTFYGETTATPMSYVGFSGLPSTAASLTAQYGIYDINTNQQIGPIGLDIPNQRLIGNQTVAPHNINLYDAASLVATPTKNFPIDQRNYGSQNTSFGTGSIDFTLDGSRVFCLDTGNGIIAFSLNARVAALSICAQPQTNIVAGPGSLGFMDVTAIGAPQQFQWRLNGTQLLSATNRTLDIYNVQPGNLGFYSVIITNPMGLGSVTSSVAVLDTQMVVTNQPASQFVTPGGTASFTVGVSNGLPAYTYQWLFWGTNTVGSGQTLTLNNVQLPNAGAYSVVITDSLGQKVTSASATLYVGQAGTGNGLRGEYYNLAAFSGPPANPFSSGTLVGSEVDPTVNFNFGTGNIGPAQTDYVTVRWSGQVQPLYSQTYTFYTTSDDGSALWVNGLKVVNNWFTQGPTERSGTLDLTAGQKYDMVMEYYEQTVGAVAQLRWSGQYLPKEIVPQSQLYAAASSPVHPTLNSIQVDATHIKFTWDGSYVLVSANNLSGPWNPVSNATSPYTLSIDPNQPEMFFRLLSQ